MTKNLANHWLSRRYLQLFVLVLITGCFSVTPQPTQIQSIQVTETNTPTKFPSTDTPIPPKDTATPLPPTATPTQTFTPSPTETLVPTETPTVTPTETLLPPTPSGDDAVYVYYIQLDTGGQVSCGDSLIRANTGVWRTGNIENDAATALKRLFYKREYFGNLYNPVYLSNLEVSNVSFKPSSGEVSIDLRGTYVRSGDRCDDSRVRAQIWSTIRQFPEVKSVYILLNGNLLGDILATGK